MTVNGELRTLWRAVDQEGEALEAYVSKRRDHKAALRFLRKLMKRHGAPERVVTDNLRSYRAAMKSIGNEGIQDSKIWHNNRAESSHQPFRCREQAILKFRSFLTLQIFVSIHSAIHTNISRRRHVEHRDRFKSMRSEALAGWRQLAA